MPSVIQRTSEGYALVKYNAEYLRDHLPIPVDREVAPTATTN